MSRITDAILGDSAYGAKSNIAQVDLSYGGQHGWSPNLDEWVNNSAYINNNLICILLEAPKFFNRMPQPDKWVQSLRNLLQLHAKTIEGFSRGLTADFEEHEIGGAGEMQQELTDVKRDRSEPVFGFQEKYGRPIQTLIEQWILYGMMDPDSKYPGIVTLGEKPNDHLADQYSASILVFETDPTHSQIAKSWVTTNLMPKGTGEIKGEKDLTSAKTKLDLSIEFTGFSQSNIGTDIFAQSLLDNINLNNVNPYLKSSFIENIDADVSAHEGGYLNNPNP